jgi:hypothetical protein
MSRSVVGVNLAVMITWATGLGDRLESARLVTFPLCRTADDLRICRKIQHGDLGVEGWARGKGFQKQNSADCAHSPA